MKRAILQTIPLARRLDEYLCRRYVGGPARERYLRGHYYSPLPDIEWVMESKERLYDSKTQVGDDINLNEEQQLSLLERLAAHYRAFPYFGSFPGGLRFSLDQNAFCTGDALILYAMLREFEPKRVIEIGSGHSSALIVDTLEASPGAAAITCIEPYPTLLRSLLSHDDSERVEIVEAQVQEVPLAKFDELADGDVLFIDSSHVSRIGSDVNYLMFDVIPRLTPGVIVHFHDIIWPFEYPLEWIQMGRAWNEAYLVRAFLQYNEAFEVILFNSYAGHAFADFFAQRMPRFLDNTGGSLWLRKLS